MPMPMQSMPMPMGEPAMAPPVPPEAAVGTGHKWLEPVSMEGTHKGLDVQAVEGTPALAMADGVVVRVWDEPEGLGLQVAVQGQDGKVRRYAHLSKVLVQEGDQVHAGDHIADVGSSGEGSTGAHLDIRKQDGMTGQYEDPSPELGPMAQMPRADKPSPDEMLGQDQWRPQFGAGQGVGVGAGGGGGLVAPLPPGGVFGQSKWMPGNGIDVFVRRGTPIYAPFDGYVGPNPRAMPSPMGPVPSFLVQGQNGLTFQASHAQMVAQGPVRAGQVVGYVNDPGLDILGGYQGMPDGFQHLDMTIGHGGPFMTQGGDINALDFLGATGYQGQQIPGATRGPNGGPMGGMGMGPMSMGLGGFGGMGGPMGMMGGGPPMMGMGMGMGGPPGMGMGGSMDPFSMMGGGGMMGGSPFGGGFGGMGSMGMGMPGMGMGGSPMGGGMGSPFGGGFGGSSMMGGFGGGMGGSPMMGMGMPPMMGGGGMGGGSPFGGGGGFGGGMPPPMMSGMSSFGGGSPFGGSSSFGGGSLGGSLLGGAGGFTMSGGGFGGAPPTMESPLPPFKPLDLSSMPKPRVSSPDDFSFITSTARPELSTPGLDPWQLPSPNIPRFSSTYQTPSWMQQPGGFGGMGTGQDVGVGGDRTDVGVGEIVGPPAGGYQPGFGPGTSAGGGVGGAVGITPAGSQLLQMQREQLTLQQREMEGNLQNLNNQYQSQLAQLQQSQAFHGDDVTVRQQTLELQNQWENQKTQLQRSLAELQSRQNDLDRGLHQQEINNQFQTQMTQLQQQAQQFGQTNELEQRRLLLQDQWQKASNDLQLTIQGKNADLQQQLQAGTLGFQYRQLGSQEQQARESNQLQRELQAQQLGSQSELQAQQLAAQRALQGEQLGFQYTQLGTQTGLAQQSLQNQNQQSAQDRQLAMYNSALRNPWMQNLTGLAPEWDAQGGPAQTGRWSIQGQPTQAPQFTAPTMQTPQPAQSTFDDNTQPSSGMGGLGMGQDRWRPRVGAGQEPPGPPPGAEVYRPDRTSWWGLRPTDPEPMIEGERLRNLSHGGHETATDATSPYRSPIDPRTGTEPYRPAYPPASDVPAGPTMREQLQQQPYRPENRWLGGPMDPRTPGSIPTQPGFFGRNNPFSGGGMGANMAMVGLDVLQHVIQALPPEVQGQIDRAPQQATQAVGDWLYGQGMVLSPEANRALGEIMGPVRGALNAVNDAPQTLHDWMVPPEETQTYERVGGGQSVGAGADNNFDFGSIAGGMSPSAVANVSNPMVTMGNGSGFGSLGSPNTGNSGSNTSFNFGFTPTNFSNQYQQGFNSVGPLQLGGGFQSAPLFTPPSTPNAYYYQDWANLSPFQRAATRTQTEMSGMPWERYTANMRDWWGATGGARRMPDMSPLAAARQDPMQQMGMGQMLDTFGTSPQQYEYDQTRKWAPSQTSGAQLQA